MKIGTENSDGRTGGLDPLNGVSGQTPSAARQLQPLSGDQVTLSAAARLLQAAGESLQSGAPMRHEVVERLRALVADGQLAGDAAGLADAIIDSWIDAGEPPAAE
jgi:flagellar biosynthesis anti-sigma factor FlgM